MSDRAFDAATGHAALVTAAVVVLAAVVAVTAVYARNSLQIVAYSAVYVLGVTGFWVLYYVLSSRAAERRRELLDADADD